MERYTGFAPCPYCFESSGFGARIIPATWDEPSWAEPDPMNPCPHCDHTGMVEADEPRTLDDIENEVDPEAAAWVESIRELVSGRTA